MPSIDENNILHLLDQQIKPGVTQKVNLISSTLYTNTEINVPVIISRSKKPGPVVLITSGIHGDEFNGVEIVRQLIAKKLNRPKIGTIICIPIVNIFGFLNMERYFPDGRDLNRSFPGTKKGSLASRFAYQFVHEILPIADLCLDFHTGGAKRFNVAQIRLTEGCEKSMKYAAIFNAPFTLYSKTIAKSYRSVCVKQALPYLIFEGGMAQDNNQEIARHGLNGIIRILNHLGMLKKKFDTQGTSKASSLFIESTTWIRAGYSGLLQNKVKVGQYVKKGDLLGLITDPYGEFKRKIKARNSGYIINVNFSPIVFEGDAVFNISTKIKDDQD